MLVGFRIKLRIGHSQVKAEDDWVSYYSILALNMLRSNYAVNESHAPEGPIHALLLDGRGGASKFDWTEVANWSPEQGCLWLHLNFEHPRYHHLPAPPSVYQ